MPILTKKELAECWSVEEEIRAASARDGIEQPLSPSPFQAQDPRYALGRRLNAIDLDQDLTLKFLFRQYRDRSLSFFGAEFPSSLVVLSLLGSGRFSPRPQVIWLYASEIKG